MIYDGEIKAMLDAAQTAGSIQLSKKHAIQNIEIKSDRSPVTEIDKQCETVIRDIITRQFPLDAFLGEETGEEKGQSGRRWIVDPLDGTRPFIRGLPTHSVLIALEDGQDLVAACIHLPALSETYWAQKGKGAFLNNQNIHVSSTKYLEVAMGSGFGFVEKQDTKDGKSLLELMKKWDYPYGFMDAYTYGCIASGKIDVCANLLDKPWDCAAGACIVSIAGGRYSDIRGNPTIYNGSIILSNGFLHDDVLEYFR